MNGLDVIAQIDVQSVEDRWKHGGRVLFPPSFPQAFPHLLSNTSKGAASDGCITFRGPRLLGFRTVHPLIEGFATEYLQTVGQNSDLLYGRF